MISMASVASSVATPDNADSCDSCVNEASQQDARYFGHVKMTARRPFGLRQHRSSFLDERFVQQFLQQTSAALKHRMRALSPDTQSLQFARKLVI